MAWPSMQLLAGRLQRAMLKIISVSSCLQTCMMFCNGEIFALHLISGCDKGHMKDAYDKCALRLPLTVKGHLQVLQQLPLPRQLLEMTLRPLHLLQQVTHVLTSHSNLFCVYIEQFLGSKETWLCPAQCLNSYSTAARASRHMHSQ